MQKKDVDGILITGDAPQVAKVQPFLETYLEGKKVISDGEIPTDEAVVREAAFIAQVLSSDSGVHVQYVLDISRLSLGIETVGGVFSKIIHRNTFIPIRKTCEFSTAVDNQEKVVIKDI